MLNRVWPGLTVLLLATLAFSQTDQPPLGDVARDSKARSSGQSKIITNEDLPERTPEPVPGEAGLELVAKSDVVKVFYKDLGADAEVRIEVPEGVSPMLKVDVNRDGATDPQDTYYGVRDHSEPCAGYLITDRFTTKCGTLASNADLKVTVGDNGTDFTWTIPKRELSTDKEGASFVIAYFSRGQGWNYFPSASFSDPIKIKF